MGEKPDFFPSSQNSISGKSIFGQFDVIFFNVIVFPWAGWLFPGNIIKYKFFDEKSSSSAGLRKS